MKKAFYSHLAILLLASACAKGGGVSGDVEERLAKLEKEVGEMSEFLRPIMDQQKAQKEAQAANEPDPNTRFAVSIDGNPSDGPADAPVTIIKVFDFACPYCERVSGILDDMVKEYDGKVRVVYKHFVVHPDTVALAHRASCAADKQGKFKAFKNTFWKDGFGKYKASRDPKTMGKDALIAMAKGVGLDEGKFTADMTGPECDKRVKDDMAELSKFRVQGTPSFFVNGKNTGFRGPGPFKELIDAELKAVEDSGVPAAEYYAKEVLGKGSKTFVSAADAKKK